MTATEQLEITLAGSSSDVDRCDDEHCALRWLCEGLEDWHWWNDLPAYKRRSYMRMWREENDRAESLGGPLRKARSVIGMLEESYQQTKSLAEHWAGEIRAAYLAGQPCPIKAEPKFQWVLDWAGAIAFGETPQSQLRNPQFLLT